MTDPQARPDPASVASYSYEEQTEEEMLTEVRAARKAGTLRRGGLDVQRTPPEELEKRLAGLGDQLVEGTIPVTIRMPASIVAALKEQAEREGVRGYQTLMKRWIEERLSGEPVISARDVVDALGQLHSAESALQKLLK